MERIFPKQLESLAQIAEVRRILAALNPPTPSQTNPCLVVTSSARGEGKTTLTALLATAAALQGRRQVLAVDLNWHQPALHSCFGLERTFDSTGFVRTLSLGDHLRRTPFEHLTFLPAPPPEQTPDNGSIDALDLGLAIIEQARTRFDLVFIDTTSIYPANRYMVDPVVLAQASTGVILAVLTSVTPRQLVKKTVTSLQTRGVPLLGTVANQWRNPLARDGMP